MRTIQEEVPDSKQGDPCYFILRGPHSLSAPTASEDLRRETIELRRQQNALQLQQNRIVELLALNQNRRKLPQLSVPVFDGNPIAYRTFARANESLIESRTFSSTDRLFKSLYDPVTCVLLRKKFGDEYYIAFAYETKALDWPNIRAEDSMALDCFSIFLASCKGALAGSR